MDCQTIRLPLHLCILVEKNIVECRPLLGALPLSLVTGVRVLQVDLDLLLRVVGAAAAGSGSLQHHLAAVCRLLREMGGAQRNLAPRNHFLVWIVKTSGCHRTDKHLTSRAFTEDQTIWYRVPTPPRSTSLSLGSSSWGGPSGSASSILSLLLV